MPFWLDEEETSHQRPELAPSNTVATPSPARGNVAHTIDSEALRRAYEWLESSRRYPQPTPQVPARDERGRFAPSLTQGNVANAEPSRPWNTVAEAPTLLERAGPVNKRGIKGWFAKLDSAAI